MSLIITLPTPKAVTIGTETVKTITAITVEREIDDSVNKKVAVVTAELGYIILWEGTAYDSIGQWTDTDVENKLRTLYN